MPSRSSIHRCLTRHGLIELRRRRKRRERVPALATRPAYAAVASASHHVRGELSCALNFRALAEEHDHSQRRL